MPPATDHPEMKVHDMSTPLSRIREQLKVVDLLFEVRDARLPVSSAHPATAELFGNKPKIVVLAKHDLADPEAVARWIRIFEKEQLCKAIALSLKVSKGKNKLIDLALAVTADKREAQKRKGLLPRAMRACVVGLPNVGKSSLINWLIGVKKVAVADRPGVTRGASWVRVHPQLELLDTPGILPPVMFKGEQATKLALCNIIPGDHYSIDEVAEKALSLLHQTRASGLSTYGVTLESEPTLEDVARARACLGAGGKFDLKRAAAIVVSDFRSGKLGRVVFDQLESGTIDEQNDHGTDIDIVENSETAS